MDELKGLYIAAKHKEDKIKISKLALHFFKTLSQQYEPTDYQSTGDDKYATFHSDYGRVHSISQNMGFWAREQETLAESPDFTPARIC